MNVSLPEGQIHFGPLRPQTEVVKQNFEDLAKWASQPTDLNANLELESNKWENLRSNQEQYMRELAAIYPEVGMIAKPNAFTNRDYQNGNGKHGYFLMNGHPEYWVPIRTGKSKFQFVSPVQSWWLQREAAQKFWEWLKPDFTDSSKVSKSPNYNPGVIDPNGFAGTDTTVFKIPSILGLKQNGLLNSVTSNGIGKWWPDFPTSLEDLNRHRVRYSSEKPLLIEDNTPPEAVMEAVPSHPKGVSSQPKAETSSSSLVEVGRTPSTTTTPSGNGVTSSPEEDASNTGEPGTDDTNERNVAEQNDSNEDNEEISAEDQTVPTHRNIITSMYEFLTTSNEGAPSLPRSGKPPSRGHLQIGGSSSSTSTGHRAALTNHHIAKKLKTNFFKFEPMRRATPPAAIMYRDPAKTWRGYDNVGPNAPETNPDIVDKPNPKSLTDQFMWYREPGPSTRSKRSMDANSVNKNSMEESYLKAKNKAPLPVRGNKDEINEVNEQAEEEEKGKFMKFALSGQKKLKERLMKVGLGGKQLFPEATTGDWFEMNSMRRPQGLELRTGGRYPGVPDIKTLQDLESASEELYVENEPDLMDNIAHRDIARSKKSAKLSMKEKLADVKDALKDKVKEIKDGFVGKSIQESQDPHLEELPPVEMASNDPGRVMRIDTRDKLPSQRFIEEQKAKKFDIIPGAITLDPDPWTKVEVQVKRPGETMRSVSQKLFPRYGSWDYAINQTLALNQKHAGGMGGRKFGNAVGDAKIGEGLPKSV